MSNVHPDVVAALEMARELRHRIADMRERIDQIRARRPSPGGGVIPEVDAMGRLLDLYIAPGTAARYGNNELSSEIMAAIGESTADAARQHHVIMNTVEPPPDLVDDAGDSDDDESAESVAR